MKKSTLINILGIILLVLIIIGLIIFWASSSSNTTSVSTVIENPQFTGSFNNTLTVMTYNIGYASGLKNNLGNVLKKDEIYTNLDKIVAVIKKNKVDILATQEIDFHSRRSHYINQLEYIAQKSEFKYTAYIINWDKKYVPYPVDLSFSKHFGHVESGQAVLSRYPILENKCYFLKEPINKPFWYNMFYIKRAVQCVKIKITDTKIIDLYNVHLEAYHTPTRELQVDQLLDIKSRNNFISGIIAGDFNALPPEATKKYGFIDEPEIDFRNDTTIKKMYEQSNLKEIISQELYRSEEKSTFTFPSNNPTRRLDYIFYSDDFVLQKWLIDKTALTGSDHLPVIAVFKIEK
jgi:endonuclease/exonuclease/phosphatase family metal-dependent hydrolase